MVLVFIVAGRKLVVLIFLFRFFRNSYEAVGLVHVGVFVKEVIEKSCIYVAPHTNHPLANIDIFIVPHAPPINYTFFMGGYCPKPFTKIVVYMKAGGENSKREQADVKECRHIRKFFGE